MTPTISEDAVEHGEVFTRRWVVDLILDLAGYTPEKDLAAMAAVEPACGTGAFLGPMVKRLAASMKAQGREDLADAADAIRVFDLIDRNVKASRVLAASVLVAEGWTRGEAEAVAEKWVATGDYLLREADERSADFVLGNPPYIRYDDIPAEMMAAYRRAAPTMASGRGDIYLGFIEHGLRCLAPDGRLGFIVADRWMRNSYGRLLREYVSREWAMDVSITMHDVDAFEDDVSAYPAIVVLRRGKQGRAVVADTTHRFSETDASAVLKWTRAKRPKPVVSDRYAIAALPHWFSGTDLWPSGSPAVLAMIEHLNDQFAPLQDPTTGTKVGIGVATGADGVYVTRDPDVAEDDRMLKLVMSRDIVSGHLRWSGHYLVNPWLPDGSLARLNEFPRMRDYFTGHTASLRKRNIARRSGDDGWFRTIDKVTHALTERPKLLLSDMTMSARPVLDEGGHYPHHNLQYIVSDSWDLRVLGGLLLSDVTTATVGAYCVKMRGGTLRFTAQYLRRIRVPELGSISAEDQAALAKAFETRDTAAATKLAVRLYGLTDAMAAAIRRS